MTGLACEPTCAEVAMRRITNALATMMWTLVLLVGIPAALVRLVGWPLPRHLPTTQQLQAWAEQPQRQLMRAVLVDGAVVLGWLLWALLLVVVLTELYRLL